jgi:hypothetical protein
MGPRVRVRRQRAIVEMFREEDVPVLYVHSGYYTARV